MSKNYGKGDLVARYRRIYSETGIYHAMSRGNNKSDIFVDVEDKKRYLNILMEKMGDCNFTLYACCIMDNHSHLIIKEEDQSLSEIMKRINISYANYFNRKYDRVGHVFQGRYRSEPIGDDRYLLTAVRYVHNNPVEAKLVKKCEDFPWSSYNYYIGRFSNGIIDKDFVLSLFAKELDKSIQLFEDFSKKENEDRLIDICNIGDEPEIKGYYDAEVYIREYLKAEGLNLKDLKRRKVKDRRDKLILNLRKNSNLTIRDIAKLLDLGRSTVGDVKE